MSTKKTAYNDQTIKVLEGPDRVRLRPAVIFGSEGLEGCQHSFFEILSNAVDEAREGYGTVINVEVTKDGVLSVEDFGRGVPLDWNEPYKQYNWYLVFCELYAGGKYNNEEGGAYEFSLGLNGLGACSTQYVSEFMEVYSCSRGVKSSIKFKKGYNVTDLMKEPCAKNKTGTLIRWKPDKEVFTNTDIPLDYFRTVLKKQAIVNPGIKFTLNFEKKNGERFKSEYYYADGITDYVKEIVGETALNTPVLYSAIRTGKEREDRKETRLKISFSFAFSTEAALIEYYHNSSFLEHGGSPDKAVRSAFVSSFDKYMKAAGKYNKSESKIIFSDIEDSLVLVVNSFSTMPSFENQTKKSISSDFIQKSMTEFFSKTLESFFAENPAETDKICQRILVNKRSREASDHLRRDVKKKLTTTLDINNTVEKFVPCRSKDPSVCELYIVEGDSAMSSCKTARNSEFQAIMPVRGKTFNCLKANSLEKILQSDIITDLLKVIGCGVELKGKGTAKFAAFDMKLLRWNKIIICTDADEDGYHIRTLILTLFYTLLPTLIKEGKIYIAETPLFEIVSKEKSYFAYTEAEKVKIIEKLGTAKYTIHRSKGLGENNADMMSLTTMAPATRRLVRIVPSGDELHTDFLFNALLGNDIESRKTYISENGAKYVDMADI